MNQEIKHARQYAEAMGIIDGNYQIVIDKTNALGGTWKEIKMFHLTKETAEKRIGWYKNARIEKMN